MDRSQDPEDVGHGILTAEEQDEVRQRAFFMPDERASELLEELAKREVQLLTDPRFGSDPARRDEILWNVAALSAAAERMAPTGWDVSPGRRGTPGSGKPEDPP